MSETDRAILAIVLALLWAGALGFNAFFSVDRILDRREEGVSPLPIVGSLCGIAVLLLAPFWTWSGRLLLLPLGLLPDIVPLIEGRLHAWRRARTKP